MHDLDFGKTHPGYVFGHARHTDGTLFVQKRAQIPGNTLLVVTDTLGWVSLVFQLCKIVHFSPFFGSFLAILGTHND